LKVIKPIILVGLLCIFASDLQAQVKAIPQPLKDTALTKVDSLKPAIVTASLRPHMQGDTLEYNTEHIQMPPNSMVEELLRRLPGLQVDPDGTITYNGQKIDHLLVDGEDIFGSDPTMVTRNFDASKIARVQVLNRKSDQAIFTGIDDGNRTKTLNLVMKESAKNGYFGKIEAGRNTGSYYNANAALAAFRDKEQFTALGIASNIGTTGFSSYGGGSSSGIYFLNGNTDPLGASAGTGIPHFAATALHFANTWNESGSHLLTNYQYSHYFTNPLTSSQSFQTQEDSIYGEKQKSESMNQQEQHWIAGAYDWAPDTRSSFKFELYGSNSQGRNQFGTMSIGTFNDTLVNRSSRTIQDNLIRQNVGGDISWRIRIGKQENRVFSVNAGMDKINLATNGYLYSRNQFYESNGSIQSSDTIDQRKEINSHSLTIDGSINYVQPLWEKAVLGFSFKLSRTVDAPFQSTFDRGNGKYDSLIDSLSSHYQMATINQQATINLQGKTGRLYYVIGNEWIAYNYQQENMLEDSFSHLHHNNLAPTLLANYTPSSATNFIFNYHAYMQHPSIIQLTPITNNSDPLHIILGNPGLKPAFNQNLILELSNVKTWNINLRLNLTLTSNSISTKTITDSLGRQISQSVNVDGGHTASLNFLIGRKVQGFDVSGHVVGTFTRTANYIDADINQNSVYTSGGGFNLNKFEAEKYNLQLSTDFTYFGQVSSINSNASVHYWSQHHQGSLTFYFTRNFEINTNATYIWQEKITTFSTNTSTLFWNGSINKNFLHNKLVARIQLKNILNQNGGISRTNSANINTQSSTNVLGRYWMLSATYHFDKKFKK